ncbi:hypothetical protein NM208_g15874 [Fusarium decemcellulare]|uniref:Uncharacterized protein n=1 Tax=Fusarium decemcellulare TaxID=57161 RepID=A0ACC1RBS7_9HYPO|nr:hypothetical protein NM208_g15874 [Fusarium decemcellulare]
MLAQKEKMKDKERDESAAEISKLLKLLYLRTQGPENAASCLHLQGETSRELWFDFGPPKKLSRADFRKHFSHLRFDKALQYVAFPQIELEGNGEPPDVADLLEDMTFFFEWLGQRGVSRIIKVIVDDFKAPSHSDEAIERALTPFDVEILDWRRLDLDPISLSKIGTHLREVYLQWSGRNSVLRSWSEKEGLALIPTLEVIHLIQHEVHICPYISGV